MNNFKSWLKERKLRGVPVIDQVLSVYDSHDQVELAVPTKALHCFSGYTVPNSPFNQVMTWNIHWKLRKQREELLINFLQVNTTSGSSNTENSNADLQVIHLEIYKA